MCMRIRMHMRIQICIVRRGAVVHGARLIHLLLNRRLSLCFYAHALII